MQWIPGWLWVPDPWPPPPEYWDYSPVPLCLAFLLLVFTQFISLKVQETQEQNWKTYLPARTRETIASSPYPGTFFVFNYYLLRYHPKVLRKYHYFTAVLLITHHKNNFLGVKICAPLITCTFLFKKTISFHSCDYPSSLTWPYPPLWDCQHSDHLKPAGKLLKKHTVFSQPLSRPFLFFCGIRATASALCMQGKCCTTQLHLYPSDRFVSDTGYTSWFWERLASLGPPLAGPSVWLLHLPFILPPFSSGRRTVHKLLWQDMPSPPPSLSNHTRTSKSWV